MPHLGEFISLVVAVFWTVTALFADKASHRLGSMTANVLRLGCDTACAKNGRCMNATCDSRNLMALPAGACEHTVCRDYLVLSNQLVPNRIKVLFVPAQIGY